MSQVLLELFDLTSRHEVALQPGYACVFLALVVVEGLGRSLDPDLDLLRCAAPFIRAAVS